MKTVLVMGLAAALLFCRAADAVEVGESMDEVAKSLGLPKGKATMGKVAFWMYPEGTIEFREGKVAVVNLRSLRPEAVRAAAESASPVVKRRGLRSDGLLALYNFDSKQNAPLGADASGRNRHATVEGQPATEAGRLGTAMRCGEFSTFTVPAGSFTSPLSQITWSAWIKPEVSQHAPILEFSADPYRYGPHLWVTQDGGLSMNVWGRPRNDRVVQAAPGSVVVERWCHVACSYDGTNAMVFVNGEAAGAGQWKGLQLEVGYPFYIGLRTGWGHGDAVFRGLIDEVAIYDRALSADEVRQLCNP